MFTPWSNKLLTKRLVSNDFQSRLCIKTTSHHIGKRKHPGDEVEDPEWIVGDCLGTRLGSTTQTPFTTSAG